MNNELICVLFISVFFNDLLDGSFHHVKSFVRNLGGCIYNESNIQSCNKRNDGDLDENRMMCGERKLRKKFRVPDGI